MDRKVKFAASDGLIRELNAADQWREVLAIDPGVTFSTPPCGCCKNLLTFVWTHCPKCGGSKKQIVNRLPSFDAFCLECQHLYSIREETEKYDCL